MGDLTVAVSADDARRLLDALSTDEADVLGSSGGATYALDLVARYPGRVRTLVAHEPPVPELLPDAARYHALNEQVGETYRSEGTFAALQMFTEGVGFGNDDQAPARTEETPEDPAAEARIGANLNLFAGRLIPIIGSYEANLAALQRSSTRIVVGVGDESTPEQMATRPRTDWLSGSAASPCSSPVATAGSAAILKGSPPGSAQCWRAATTERPQPGFCQQTEYRQSTGRRQRVRGNSQRARARISR